MRITFVLPAFWVVPSGGYRVVYEYANHLTGRGHQVSVVHPRSLVEYRPPNLYRRLRRRGGRFRDAFFPPKVGWQPIDRRVQMLWVPDLRPHYVPDADAIFATAWETAGCVLGYPASKGNKFYLVQDFGPWFGPGEQLEETWRWPLKKVTVSNWLYEKVRGAGASQNDVVNIPNGVDHKRFKLIVGARRAPGTIAMYYGDLEYKSVEDGLDALRKVQASFPHLAVTLFGHKDPTADRLPPWIAHRGRVREMELVKIYNESRIFVSSSAAEGFALPPAEAMACGCAVALTDSGGIREFAEDGVTALLSPPRDPAALARNIARLLDDDDLRQQLAAAGHRRIQEFTWDRSTDQLMQFIQRHVVKGDEK